MTNFCFSTLFITIFFISISISNTLKTDPIYDLISRITPSLRDYFQLSYIETESSVSDYFILSSNSSKITIQGSLIYINNLFKSCLVSSPRRPLQMAK